MTSAELHEIVKGLEAALPQWLCWHDDGCYFHGDDPYTSLSADCVECVAEASFARWLDEHENHWGTSRHNKGVTVYSLVHGAEAGGTFRMGDGPTRLHALAAAVRAKMENTP